MDQGYQDDASGQDPLTPAGAAAAEGSPDPVMTQLAQAAGPGGAPAIGQVTASQGAVSATHLDGSRTGIAQGDTLYQGDTLETSADGGLSLAFLDGTTFDLGGNAVITLDELIYNPADGSGSFLTSVAKGTFVFLTGTIAGTGPDAMLVKTPSGNIGVRGTSVACAIESSDTQVCSLLIDPDGHVGVVAFIFPNGEVVFLTEAYQTLFISAGGGQLIQILTLDQIQTLYSDVLDETVQETEAGPLETQGGPIVLTSGGFFVPPEVGSVPSLLASTQVIDGVLVFSLISSDTIGGVFDDPFLQLNDPTAVAPTVSPIAADLEGRLPGGGAFDPASPRVVILQSLPVNFGGDQAAIFVSALDLTVLTHTGAAQSLADLTSGGQNLAFTTTTGSLTLTARIADGPNAGQLVFQMLVDENGSDAVVNANGEVVSLDGAFFRFELFLPLDNTNIGAVGADDPLTLVFAYTISDGTDDATGTITITLLDDGPAIIANPDQTVHESALPDIGSGDDPGGTTTASGTLGFVAGADGAIITAVTVAGVAGVPQGDDLVVNGGFFTFTVNVFTGAYDYLLTGPAPHAAGSDLLAQIVSYTVTDGDGDPVVGGLTILIDDDTPLAVADDGGSVDESALFDQGSGGGTRFATGNLLDNDVLGADGALITSVNGQTAVDGVITLVTEFGTLTVFTTDAAAQAAEFSSAGDYLYRLTGPALEGEVPATDEFAYSLTDGDGDSSTAVLTITINDDRPLAVDDDGGSVDESALPDGGSGGGTRFASGNLLGNDTQGADGAAIVSVNGQAAVDGVITLVTEFGSLTVFTTDAAAQAADFSAAGDWIYRLDSPTGAVPASEVFSYVLTDGDGDSSTADLTIGINDDGPVATGDTSDEATVFEAGLDDGSGQGPLTTTIVGSFADNINFGADGFGGVIQVLGVFPVNGVITIASEPGSPLGAWILEVTAATGAYSFTLLDESLTHDDPAAIGLADVISIPTFTALMQDGDGNTIAATLDVALGDDGPFVFNDANQAVEGGSPVTGNLLSGAASSGQNSDADQGGADGIAVIDQISHEGITYTFIDGVILSQGQFSFEVGVLTIATALGGSFSINLNGQTGAFGGMGGYSYSPPSVANGSDGDSETFGYRVEDGDGDSAQANLVVALESVAGVPAATLAVAGDLPFLTEDVTGALAFSATPVGDDAITQITISGFPAGWAVLTGSLALSQGTASNVVFTGGTLTFDLSGASGPVTGSVNVTPGPANGDGDALLTINATASDGASSASSSNSGNAPIAVDAAVDGSQVTQATASGLENTTIGLGLSIVLGGDSTTSADATTPAGTAADSQGGADSDGSEAVTEVTVTFSSGALGFTLPPSMSQADVLTDQGIAIFDTSGISFADVQALVASLQVTPAQGFDGVITGSVTTVTSEVNTNGVEPNASNNSDTDVYPFTVTVIDATPVALDDNGSVDESALFNGTGGGTTTATGNLLGNDIPGADGAVITSVAGQTPNNGVIVIESAVWTLFVYTTNAAAQNAQAGVAGAYVFQLTGAVTDGPGPEEATFPYIITDGDGDEATATLTVTINDDAPQAADDNPPAMVANGSITVNVLANDALGADGIDINDGVSVTGGPSNGTAFYNGDGGIAYTPNQGFVGTDSFTYRLTDRDGDSSTAVVTVQVNPQLLVAGPQLSAGGAAAAQGLAITLTDLQSGAMTSGGLAVPVGTDPDFKLLTLAPALDADAGDRHSLTVDFAGGSGTINLDGSDLAAGLGAQIGADLDLVVPGGDTNVTLGWTGTVHEGALYRLGPTSDPADKALTVGVPIGYLFLDDQGQVAGTAPETTLQLDAVANDGFNLDLGDLTVARFTGAALETIDISGNPLSGDPTAENNSLTLSAQDLLDFAGDPNGSDDLTILGNDGDRVTLVVQDADGTGQWQQGASDGSLTTYSYVDATGLVASLRIDDEVTVTGVA